MRTQLAIALLTLGCATTHGVRDVGGIEVHTFRRDWTNAHLVRGPAGAFLFDAGYERNGAALAEDIRSVGVEPGSLRAVIVSHGHADHAGGARYFREHYGVPIIAGGGDEAALGAGHNDTLCPTNDTARDRLAQDQADTFTPFEADVLVRAPLDLTSLTGVPGRVVPLAGHTEGSLVVVVGADPDQAALVGDLFRGELFTSGAAVHFYMCDLADNRRDVNELLTSIAPNAATFFPGHFGPLSRGAVLDAFPSATP